MHIQNSEILYENDEIIQKDKIINILLIVGFCTDMFNYILITSQTLAPQLLHEYYSEHKFLIQIIYILGGLILIGVLSARVFYKLNFKNKINSLFNQVEVK